jgi:hypothetical protein
MDEETGVQNLKQSTTTEDIQTGQALVFKFKMD